MHTLLKVNLKMDIEHFLTTASLVAAKVTQLFNFRCSCVTFKVNKVYLKRKYLLGKMWRQRPDGPPRTRGLPTGAGRPRPDESRERKNIVL